MKIHSIPLKIKVKLLYINTTLFYTIFYNNFFSYYYKFSLLRKEKK